MKLYLISQEANQGYDTYDAAVVCAPDELTARNIIPWDCAPMTQEDAMTMRSSCWASAEQVSAKYLGEADHGVEQGVVLASFNAG